MKQNSKLSTFFQYALFPVALLFEEIWLLLFSTGVKSPLYVIYIALFSICLSTVFFYLTTITKKPVVNRTMKLVFLIAFAFLFSILYLCYTEYQFFYDLNTMLSGAGGVGDYVNEINAMVFCPKGILHLSMCYLPVFFYIIVGMAMKKDKAVNATSAERLNVFYVLFAALLVVWIVIGKHPEDHAVYTHEYSFAESVPRFGLLESLEVELVNMAKKDSGADDMTFATLQTAPVIETPVVTTPQPVKETKPVDTEVSENEIPEPEEIVYTPNMLDIDFLALAEGAPDNLANLDYYVASQVPSMKNEYTGLFKGKNLILITAEAFSAEAIDEVRTPTLYRMATKGIQFTDYYQPAGAGTTGGEFQNVFGMLCVDGGASFKETQSHYNYMTMGTQLCRNYGYSGGTFHNGSVTYYDRHLTHVNIGYPDGFMANGNGLEKLVTPGKASYDSEMFPAVVGTYLDKAPFNLYFMSVSGHSPYYPMGNKFAGQFYYDMADLNYSDMVKGYFSTQMEFDKAMELTIEMLEEAGIADDTVIVIGSDHFPYGLQADGAGNSYLAEMYGEPVADNFILNHNRLIIWSGCLEEEEPIVVDSPVCSIDILPTLLNLFGVDYDSRLLPGRDVFSDQEAIVYFTNYHWKTELGTFKGSFYPNEGVEVPEGYVDRIKTIVKDKITYTKGVLWYDYYRHVFAKEAEEDALPKPEAETPVEPEETPVEEGIVEPVDTELP